MNRKYGWVRPLIEEGYPASATQMMVMLKYLDAKELEISYEELAEKAGLSKRTALVTVHMLEECGLLQIEKGSGRERNKYTIIPCVEELDLVEDED